MILKMRAEVHLFYEQLYFTDLSIRLVPTICSNRSRFLIKADLIPTAIITRSVRLYANMEKSRYRKKFVSIIT